MARTKPAPLQPNTSDDNVLPFPPPSTATPANAALPAYNPLTASATLITPNRHTNPRFEEWQAQAWNFYDSIEYLSYGVDWLAKMISRVRLVAAELPTGADEPVLLTDGPAAELITRMAGGVGGQAQLLKEFTVHYSVAGMCWLVGEQPDPTLQLSVPGAPTEETWTIYSADELRTARRKYPGQPLGSSQDVYEVRVAEDVENSKSWRILSRNSVVVKCWSPHPRWGWKPDSPTRHALAACVELDLVNKRIMAMLISRLANNGVLLYDKSRMSLPTRTNPNDPQNIANSPSDLAQVFVDVAKQAMADPASPAACIPIPIGFEIPDLSDVDPKLLMQHLTFSEGVDEKLLALRDSAIRRLATAIDLPANILLEPDSANHWAASQSEESAIKVHVTPVAELICYSLTTGFLYPMLRANNLPLTGPAGGRLLVWYDPSEIVVRPDKSTNAMAAYDREEITGATLRREIGVDEGDAPTLEQQTEMLLRKQARDGSIQALQVLDGVIKLGDIQPSADPGVRPDDSAATGRPPNAPDKPPAASPPGAPPDSTPPGGDTPSPAPRRTAPDDDPAPPRRTP